MRSLLGIGLIKGPSRPSEPPIGVASTRPLEEAAEPEQPDPYDRDVIDDDDD